MNYATMNYVDRLSMALYEAAPTPTDAKLHAKIIQDNVAVVLGLIGSLKPSQKIIVTNHVIKSLLQYASQISSNNAGRNMRWSTRPKWAPVREGLSREGLLGEDQQGGLADKVNKINRAVAEIAGGLRWLSYLPQETFGKIIKQIITRLKGKAVFTRDTEAWQKQNMPAAVERYVGEALRKGKRNIRFDTRGLSKPTIVNLLKNYRASFQARGIEPAFRLRGDPSNPNGIDALIGGSLDLKAAVDAEAPIAKSSGPSRDGKYLINLGDVLSRVRAGDALDDNAIRRVLLFQLRASGIDPRRVKFGRQQPGTRRQQPVPGMGASGT